MDALNIIPAELDHLVITVPDLESGVAAVEESTGVRAVPGGSHPGRGTANFLLGLAPTGWPKGAHTYLEILGPDPQQEPPADGTLPLDAHLATEPTLQTWAIHPPAFLAKIAAANTAGIDFGEVQDMARDTAEGDRLEWRLTARSPLPREGAQPFLIDWGESVHPAEAALPALELLEFRVESPEPESALQVLEVLGAGDTTVVEGSDRRLRARLRGPDGVLEF
ncbi:Glyoxalase-like domain-containing protein [Brevibacterium siliguriense]|uniref:Glyoxalase-like domain-containing protein n=1 Tax=Brevibacterium siliguriense TaxID=1136497 RepID=A0A1H1XEZ3_9MICO|nr:VOC family protein [Brevibacterium siliguriense]SDT07289.1 Glyoxalase-like domain-containing protein [Brevibacterium siliguriense]